jgi:hypothetical protein
MRIEAKNPDEYISQLSIERQGVMSELRQMILKNLPKGFQEAMSYGMIGYVVPHSIYPDGYHCDPKLPLPFLSVASQKNHIAFYHMGMYADENLYNWFKTQFEARYTNKLDMGKSCVRFKKPEHVPLELIGELVQKMTPQQWIDIYEKAYKK